MYSGKFSLRRGKKNIFLSKKHLNIIKSKQYNVYLPLSGVDSGNSTDPYFEI